MNAPVIQVGALVELQVDGFGFVEEPAARTACRAVDASDGPATVLIRGVLMSGRASIAAARQVGAALATAERIEVLGNGPGVVEFASLLQAAAAKERRFRAHPSISG